MRLLVLDGNSIINRAFYGIRTLTTKDGVYTNAVYGFINILFKLQEQVSPDITVAAFDLKAPTFRHKMYAEYKAGRKPMPPELAQQFPLLKELLPKMGVTVKELEGYEADDILGTFARWSKEKGGECFIATGDRDSLQLVDENTTVLLAATKAGRPDLQVYDIPAIKEKYGVEPLQLIDVKALMGDSSDNIPGVAGVGEKTAIDLVKRFGSIKKLYENIDSEDIRETVRTKLKNDKDNAFLSYTLGTIVKDVPLDIDKEKLLSAGIQPDELYTALARLEFFKIIEKMGLKPGAAAQQVNNEPAQKMPVVTNQLPEKSGDMICFVWQKTVDGIALCVNADGTLYIIDDNEKIDEFFDNDAPLCTCDVKGLYAVGYYPKNVVFDLALAGYLQNPSGKDYTVEKLAIEYSVVPGECDVDEKYRNLVRDGSCIVKLYNILNGKIEADEQTELLTDIEIPLSGVLDSMEKEGFYVDAEGLKEFGETIQKDIDRLQQEIYDDVGYEFNLNSPKQLGEALFVKLGLPAKKKTKSGFSTDAAVLESIKNQHPAVRKLLEYRQLAKLKSTYVDGLLGVIASDGRIHSSFNQTETRTGRISSSEPNLQNIPVRRTLGRELRRFFAAKEGCVLCDADYSQIELRVLAHVANDEAMITAFNEGQDIHAATAARVFNMPENMVTPLMRSRAKAVNFGIVYGIGAYSLANDLGISFAEAKKYISGYMENYKGVSDYMEKVVQRAKQDGYVTTMFNRKRLLPEINASNAITRGFGERVARNMPIQGTAADIIKIAMIRVYNALKDEGLKAKLILQIHDELIVETPTDEVEKVKTILKREMENAVSLKVPLTVDLNSGKTWYDTK